MRLGGIGLAMSHFVDLLQEIVTTILENSTTRQSFLESTKEIPSNELYQAPQFTDGPCKFVNANDGSKDCVALLITHEMIEDFRKYSHLGFDGHHFTVRQEALEDADLLPYHDALEHQDSGPQKPGRTHGSCSSRHSDSSIASSRKLLRRAIWAKFTGAYRAMFKAESHFDFMQDVYTHAFELWKDGRTEWTQFETKSAFDRKVLHDKMLATTRLIDLEEMVSIVRADAEDCGMLTDIERYEGNFHPDAEYQQYDADWEAGYKLARLDRGRIERWMEDMDDVETDVEMEDVTADEWEATSIWFNESGSTKEIENKLLVSWAGYCDRVRGKCEADMSRRDLWGESRQNPRRSSWGGGLL